MERRFIPFEKRAKKGLLEGYAVYWGIENKMPYGTEKFLKDSLVPDEDGVSFFVMHNEQRILGNSKSGTLKLESDDRGLKYQVQLPESAKDIKEAVEREDFQGVSVSFLPEKDKYEGDCRTVLKGRLDEISLVDKPALRTSLSMRSKKKRVPSWSKLVC